MPVGNTAVAHSILYLSGRISILLASSTASAIAGLEVGNRRRGREITGWSLKLEEKHPGSSSVTCREESGLRRPLSDPGSLYKDAIIVLLTWGRCNRQKLLLSPPPSQQIG